MPYKLVKKSKGRAEVVNSKTGKSHGVTTITKAKSQMRLLYAVEKNPKFKPRYTKKVSDMGK